jgi:hypothetical protein
MARYCNDYIKKALDVQAKVSNKLREALNKCSLSVLLENRDDHKARDAGRSWDYDAKERNAMSARFYRNPGGRGFAGGLPCQAPSEEGQPFASSPFAHPIPQSRRRASVDLFSASLVASLLYYLPLWSNGMYVKSFCQVIAIEMCFSTTGMPWRESRVEG